MRPLVMVRLGSLGLVPGLLTVPAEAHIKWFAPYDVPAQPRILSDVFSAGYIQLIVIALVILVVACWVERTALGIALSRSFDRLGGGIRAAQRGSLRAGTGAFFVMLFALGNIILTPELINGVAAIQWLARRHCARHGLALDHGLLGGRDRRTLCLWRCCLWRLPLARLSDFSRPCRLSRAHRGARQIDNFRPIDVARWGVAIT